MCVEPNDAERHSLHESDDEISELKSEILALKVKGKKLLNIIWDLTSLFLKNIEDSTTLILPNPNDPEKGGPFWLRLNINYVTIKLAFSGFKFHNVKGRLISNKP